MHSLLPMSTVVGPRVRMTSEQVENLLRHGGLEQDDGNELLDGVLIQMPPIGPDHANVTNVLTTRLVMAYHGLGFVQCANPLDVGVFSRPQPDLSVIAGNVGAFRGRIPRADEALLIIEVSVSTLERDRAKGLLYAQGGAPVYWIVDFDGRRIEVHEDPTEDGYRRVTLISAAETVTPPGLSVGWRVGEIFGDP